jgi:serine/threonine protein kinase
MGLWFMSGFSEDFCDFCSQCLTNDPTLRPTAIELLSHLFVRNIDLEDSMDGSNNEDEGEEDLE